MNDVEYILRIVLKARDEIASVLARARGELRAFSSQANDSSGGIASLNTRMKALNGHLDRLVDRLDNAGLAFKRFASRKSDSDDLIDKNVKLFERMHESVHSLGDGIRETTRDVDDHEKAEGRLGESVRRNRKDVDDSRSAWSRFASQLGQTGDNVATLDNRIRGIGLLIVFGFAQQLITALLGLGGELVAVAGSAAMAGAALGGIFVAGIAQAIPAIGLLSAALIRVKSVFDAVQQSVQAQQQKFIQGKKASQVASDGADQIANAQDSLASAHRRVADAQDQVTQAQRRLKLSQEALTLARRAARRDLEDLILAERSAELAAKGAVLSQTEAQEQLRLAVQQGDVGALARDEIGVDQADIDRREAELRKSRQLADERRAERGGIEGSRGVEQAKREAQDSLKALSDARNSVADAERGVDRANRGLEKARRNATEAVAGTQSATATLDFLLSKLSPAERRLYESLLRIRKTYQTVFTPVTDIIINSFTKTVGKVNSLLKMPAVIKTISGLSTEISKQIDKIVSAATSPKQLSQFQRLIEQSEKNIGPITDIVLKLVHAFLSIAEAGGPALSKFIGFISDLADRFVALTNNKDKLEDFFLTGERHLESWINLGISILGLFSTLSGIGAPTGLRSIRDATKEIDKLTKKANDNSKDVAKFFEDARAVTNDLVRVLVALGEEIFKSFDPDRVHKFADFLINSVIPAFGIVLRTVGQVSDLIVTILDLPFIRTLAKWGIAALIFGQVFASATGAVIYFGRIFGHIKDVLVVFGAPLAAFLTKFKAVQVIVSSVNLALAGMATGLATLFTKLPLLNRFAEALRGFAAARLGIGGGAAAAGAAAGAGASSRTTSTRGPGAPIIAPIGRGAGGVAAADEALAGATKVSSFSKFFGALKVLGTKLGWIGLGITVVDGFYTAITTDGNVIKKAQAAGEEILNSVSFGLFKTSSEKEKEWADKIGSMVDAVRKLTAAGNDKGLGKLSDAIGATAHAMRIFGENDMADDLDAIGKSARDAARDIQDKLAGSVAGAKIASEVSKDGKITQKEIKKISDSINKLPPESQHAAKQTMLGMFRAMEQYGGLPVGSSEKVRRRVNRQFALMQIGAAKNIVQMMKDSGIGFGSIAEVSRAAMEAMGVNINDVMKSLGLSGFKLSLKNPVLSARAIGGVAGAIFNNLPGFLGGSSASGGFVGNAGERGRDAVGMVLGRGEAVLNWAQQKVVNAALWAQHKMTLPELFKQTKTTHGGTIGQLGLASGGFTGPYGSGEGFIPVANFAKNKFGLTMTAGRTNHSLYTSTGNISDHSTGMAGDFSNGTETPQEDAFNSFWKTRVPQVVKQLIWRGKDQFGGFPIADHFDHVHLAMLRNFAFNAGNMAKIISRASRGLSISDLLANASSVDHIERMVVKGPNTLMKKIVQKGLDKVWRGANKFIDKKAGILNVPIAPGANDIDLLPAGKGYPIGATTFGGPGDPHTGHIGYRGDDLNVHPDSFAELDMGTALGGLPYMTKIRVTSGGKSAFAYKRDIGGGGGAINGLKRGVDLWYQLAESLGLPGVWSGGVKIARAASGGFAGIPQFAAGGIIPGLEGQPLGVIAHAGEWILNKFQQSRLASILGMNRQGLRSMLGFHGEGGDKGFAGGTEVSKADSFVTTQHESERIKRLRKGFYELPFLPITSWENLLLEAKRAFNAISKIGKGYNDALSHVRNQLEKTSEDIKKLQNQDDLTAGQQERLNSLKERSKHLSDSEKKLAKKQGGFLGSLDALTKEGGILDQMETARQKYAEKLSAALTSYSFKINKKTGEVTKRHSDVGVALKAIDNARDSLDEITGEKGVVNEALNKVNARLRQISKGGVSAGEAKEFRTLKTQQANLQDRQSTLVGAYTQGLSDIFQAQQNLVQVQIQAQQDAVDKITKKYEQQSAANDIFRRMATALGNEDWLVQINAKQRDILNNQANELEGRMAQARAAGATDLASQLADQVSDLRTQIFESIQQDIKDAADRVNTKAERRLGRLDLFGRMADALGVVGLGGAVTVGGESFSRSQIFQQRQSALEDQRSGLQGLLGQAQQQGNIGLIQDLTDQLAELDVTIKENTKAAFQAKIDDVNTQSDFSLNINDLNKQILELTGEITGNTDQAALLANAQQRGNLLQGQRSALEQLLLEAQQNGDQQAINDLTTQMLQNQVAILQNTQAINTLNGSVSDPQTFTSSAWSWFRSAIFTGMGQVLPQFNPSGIQASTMANGAIAAAGSGSGGNTNIFQGPPIGNSNDVITPTHEDNSVNLVLNKVEGPVDLTEIAAVVGFARKTDM